ncbi:OTU domain-containing protein 3-like isoform X2 [Montipora capricornis]|uniref:OTU domain-containing protein 3-like isoform X2 n=1 Tax=Montipora capricornis TaxID=246305 RepID=UPI0035F1EB48
MTKKGGNKKQSKGHRKEELERKRDDRVRRSALKKERKAKEYLEEDENFASFSNQLEALGLKIKDIPGDGNCLFRSLGDQLDGDHTTHTQHRRETVKYMRDHRSDFEPFMEDNVSFDKHLQDLSKLSTYGGNDSIVAFARNHGVNVVIHQLNEPRWVICGADYCKNGQVREVHISYHNGEHYSSVRHITDNSTEPAWIKHGQSMSAINAVRNTSSRTKEKRKANGEGKTDEAMSTVPFDSHMNQLQGDNQKLEELVMTATGCKDLVTIAQTLEENNYDVDASIRYVLQLVCVAEETGCFLGDLFGSSTTPPDNSVEEIVTSTCNSDTEAADKGTRDSTVSNDECKECTRIIDNDGDGISSSTEEISTNSSNPASEKDNSTQELTKCTKEMLSEQSDQKEKTKYENQGARPKDTSGKSRNRRNSGANSHLSNKKRKELAKRERKKRGEERRKDNSSPCLHEESPERQTISCSVVADLGLLAI